MKKTIDDGDDGEVGLGNNHRSSLPPHAQFLGRDNDGKNGTKSSLGRSFGREGGREIICGGGGGMGAVAAAAAVCTILPQASNERPIGTVACAPPPALSPDFEEVCGVSTSILI